MSHKTRINLNAVAEVLEKAANGLLNAIELILIDFVFRKAKYRKRGVRPRQVVQKTIIYRQGAPRLVYVDRLKPNQEQ